MPDIALVAGEGKLPEEIVTRLAQKGGQLVVYAFGGKGKRFEGPGVEAVVPLKTPDLEFVIGDLAARGIGELMLAGLVPKELMYRPETLGKSLAGVLESLDSRDDHSLLGAIIAAIEKTGLKVLPYRDVIPDLLAPEGVVAGRSPGDAEMEDVAYAREVARTLLPLSFGQALAVYRKAVVAVEAMEGTDRMIERAGELVPGGVLLKMMRGDQDERYDLPTVGPSTIENMASAGLTCLAVETGRTIVLERKEVARLAGETGIAVWGLR
ncbi:MAG: LpxI family protein [Thermovirgaceae bacterium]